MSDLSGYFDYNATTPMSAVAREAWHEACDRFWHNPSSLYREAGMAKQELERCREEVADHLKIDEPERVIFTSGATEANNAIIRYLAETREGKLLVSAIEHPCVEAPSQSWFGGDRCHEVSVSSETGVIDLGEIEAQLEKSTVAAVSVMAANNETGTLQPWQELSELCRAYSVPFHSDAAQWIGKLPSGELESCDFLTGSSHKFSGGKGVGFMVIPEGSDDFNGLIGGPQEGGHRAGTENLPAVMAMVAALLDRSDPHLNEVATSSAASRDSFESKMITMGMMLIGACGPRLWNTSMFVLPHTRNLKWLTRLSQRGFSVSTGSACSAGRGNPSRVMSAMGLDYEEMGRVMRISAGWDTSSEEWDALAAAIEEVAADLAQ